MPGPEPILKTPAPDQKPKSNTPEPAKKASVVDKNAGFEKQAASLEPANQKDAAAQLKLYIEGLRAARTSLADAVKARQTATASQALRQLGWHLDRVALLTSDLLDQELDTETHKLLASAESAKEAARATLAQAQGEAAMWNDESLTKAIGAKLVSVGNPRVIPAPVVKPAAKTPIKPPVQKPTEAAPSPAKEEPKPAEKAKPKVYKAYVGIVARDPNASSEAQLNNQFARITVTADGNKVLNNDVIDSLSADDRSQNPKAVREWLGKHAELIPADQVEALFQSILPQVEGKLRAPPKAKAPDRMHATDKLH